MSSAVKKSPGGWTSRLWTALCTFSDPEYPLRQAKDRIKNRLVKQTRLLTDTLGALPNVYEYTLEWNGNSGYHPEFYRAFLKPLLTGTVLSKSLQKLSIQVPPEMLNDIINVTLPRLQELECHFITGDLSIRKVLEMVQPLIVFINNLDRSLRSLTLLSTHVSQNLDFTCVFHRLGYFPRLKSFALSIPFDGGHLSEPRRLREFLCKHAQTLEHIRLGAHRATVHAIPLDPQLQSSLWIRNTLAHITVPMTALRTLHIALRPLRGDLTQLNTSLRTLAHQLESLTLTDRPLTYREVRGILDAFEHVSRDGRLKLVNLSIWVQHLSPQLIDLLAERLPKLRTLELGFKEISHQENVIQTFPRLTELVGALSHLLFAPG